MRRPKSDGREYGLAAAANRGCMSKNLVTNNFPISAATARTVILSAAKNLAWVAIRPRFFAVLRMTTHLGPNANVRCHWAVQA